MFSHALLDRRFRCAPGTVVYSTDRWFDDEPDELGRVAENLFDLKDGGGDDPESIAYGEMLADERTRAMGATVPRVMSGGRHVRSTSTMFYRKHLPGGYVAASIFPLLVHDDTTANMVVPCRFWDAMLLSFWKQ